MKLLNIILSLLIVAAGLLLGKIWYQNNQLNHISQELNKKLMEANLALGRAHTKFGNANKYISELEQKLQDEIKDRDARITRIGELIAELKAAKAGQGTTTVVTGDPVTVPAELNLAVGMLYIAIEPNKVLPLERLDAKYEDFRLLILASIKPEPNLEQKIPVHFQYNLHLKLHGQLVETITPTGAINNYIRLWEVDNDDKKVTDISLKKFEMIVEDQRQKQLFWFTPHLDLNLVGSITYPPPNSSLGIDLGISLSGYGLTRNDLDWRFLRVGLGLGDGVFVSLTPVQWNLGAPIPLVSNIWLGLGLQYNLSNHKWGHQLSLGAVL